MQSAACLARLLQLVVDWQWQQSRGGMRRRHSGGCSGSTGPHCSKLTAPILHQLLSQSVGGNWCVWLSGSRGAPTIDNTTDVILAAANPQPLPRPCRRVTEVTISKPQSLPRQTHLGSTTSCPWSSSDRQAGAKRAARRGVAASSTAVTKLATNPDPQTTDRAGG